jgi:hypothetical protein
VTVESVGGELPHVRSSPSQVQSLYPLPTPHARVSDRETGDKTQCSPTTVGDNSNYLTGPGTCQHSAHRDEHHAQASHTHDAEQLDIPPRTPLSC